MGARTAKVWIGLVAVSLFAGGCISSEHDKTKKRDRGVRFNHPLHTSEGMDCTDCHEMPAESGALPSMPSHELCVMCHDIPEEPAEDKSSCVLCHTRQDFSLAVLSPLLDNEKIFSHPAHVAAEVACATCHDEPDARAVVAQPLMEFCMDCHEQTRVELNACNVCHTTLSKTTRPSTRDGIRISHDVPDIWERIHGRESVVDPQFCAMCHGSDAFCEECHRRNAPDNHTLSFRRKIHGLRATWDRNTCAVCHEEETCLKCHRNTKPSSHRARFERPTNGHCASCHFPPQQAGCTVCHEEIEHRSAIPSPHDFNIFPTNCAACHPGGIPTRAPHLLNSTARCTVCHQ